MMAELTELRGVGPALAQKLSQAGINSALDLLFHLPRNYQDRTKLHSLGALRPGDNVLVEAIIEHSEIVERSRRMLLCQVKDGSGLLLLRFFHFYAKQYQQMTAGSRIRCFGEVRQGPHSLEMVHPEYRILQPDQQLPLADRLTPIYPNIESIGQKKLQTLIMQALELFSSEQLELIPQHMQQNFKLPSLQQSLLTVHQPTPDTDRQALLNGNHLAQQRLVLEELVAHRISLRLRRRSQQCIPAIALAQDSNLVQTWRQNLPFQLTSAQQRVISEVAADLAKPQAMLRLIQGDVGSGKTMVALAAILQAVAANKQAAIMAPTEVLAEQHWQNFNEQLAKLNIETGWLVGKLTTKARRQVLQQLADGTVQVVVGTHALFQPEVKFNNLALVVIDEQHRFGVEQRLTLQRKGEQLGNLAHQLIMTATPIPRTLAMTAYADLDVSIIDQMPPGRIPVKTLLMSEDKREQIIASVAKSCQQGRQVYWVCTLIEESETLTCQTAEDTAQNLQQALPDLAIGLVHGRMKSSEKQQVMQQFKAGKLNILVATTVIEVGVDVPGANVMIIENAERLGLSQLHQLRGRIGRGDQESFCLLLYSQPLSAKSKERLKIMRTLSDGFALAEEDLKLRGPGELIGTKQTGDIDFKIANLARDQQLLSTAQQLADQLLSQHEPAAKQLVQRWLGTRTQYQYV